MALNTFQSNEHNIMVMPDVRHLLKNMKNTMQCHLIAVPTTMHEAENIN